jgi:hypothetical protein
MGELEMPHVAINRYYSDKPYLDEWKLRLHRPGPARVRPCLLLRGLAVTPHACGRYLVAASLDAKLSKQSWRILQLHALD